MANLGDILTHLKKVKKSGHGFMALCPAHDDRNPSLSIRETADGVILLKCFAGCTVEAITGELGLQLQDLFPDNTSKRKVGETRYYLYVDEDGKPLYRICKKQGGKTWTERYDGDENWRAGLGGTRKVLYNVLDLLRSDCGRVFITEGEKDCDHLIALGLIATTNAWGAMAWWDEYNTLLKDVDVVIITDNDKTGREGAEKKARSISGVAKSVKVVDLFAERTDRDSKEDITDWLKNGGNKNSLLQLVDATEEWELEHTEIVRDGTESPEQGMKFPREIITGAAGRFAEVFSQHMECPPEFFFLSYLTILGVLISDRVALASEVGTQPRLYVLLLGESADVRKSTAIVKTIRFFETTFGSPWFDASEITFVGGVGSAEGLQREMKKNRKVLLWFDEFAGFVGKCKIQGSVLLPFTTSLFENNFYENVTKHDSVKLEDAHLSILAASTVDTFRKTWIPAFTDIGFNNRLFLVTGDAAKKYSIPPEMDEAKRAALSNDLKGLVTNLSLQAKLGLTEDARKVYHEWYMRIEQSVHTKRIDGYAMRFMVLFAINDGKKVIDSEIVEKTIALCDWQVEVRRQVSPIDGDNEIAKMENKIRRHLGKRRSMTEGELKRFCHVRETGLWVFESAIKNLTRTKEIDSTRTSRTVLYRATDELMSEA